jgi:hypothetical protein
VPFRGHRRRGPVGCAPHGANRFELGCTVEFGDWLHDLDVVVEVEPKLRIVSESLNMRGLPGTKDTVSHPLLRVEETTDGTAEFVWFNDGHEAGRTPCPNSRLLTGMAPALLAGKGPVLLPVSPAVLRGVFLLDPVPHLMRGYTPERDGDLRRTGENISAAIARLQNDDPPTFDRLCGLVRQVGDERIREIEVMRAPLGDVMLALREGDEEFDRTPAREMSDGLLRFIAVATALLTSSHGLDINPGPEPDDVTAGVLLVIEELENGLHPSQAERVLELIKETSSSLATRVLVSTHSPALLNEMTGELNRSVVVCYRDDTSDLSRLSRLTDLPGYAEAMASGRLGDAVTKGRLVGPAGRDRDYGDFNRLLGIE